MVGMRGESFECSYFLLMLEGTYAIIGNGRAIWAMVPGPQSSGPSGGRRLSCATFWTDVPGWRSPTWWNRGRTQSIRHEIGIRAQAEIPIGKKLGVSVVLKMSLAEPGWPHMGKSRLANRENLQHNLHLVQASSSKPELGCFALIVGAPQRSCKRIDRVLLGVASEPYLG